MTEVEGPEEELPDAQAHAFGPLRPARAPRLSRADVFQAADAVLLAGGRVTIDRVRAHLGRGSPNTIQDHIETWWSGLGARLRDIPGREFSGLPEEVSAALQGLWNIALDTAYAAIDGKAATRDADLSAREAAVSFRESQLVEQVRAAATRTATLEDSLNLARDQIATTNTRADRLETVLQGREAEIERLRTRSVALEGECQELRAKLDAAIGAHQTERANLDERHAANEARWLVEIDRGRQAAQETAKDHERQLKELRGQITQHQTEQHQSKRDLQEARAELRTAVTARVQADKRLSAIMLKAVKAARATPSTAGASRTAVGKRRR